MNSIPRTNSPLVAYVLSDMQIAQDENLHAHLDLNHVPPSNNSENSNEEPPFKRRRINSAFASIEPTISRMGVDVLLTQQNSTEHLPASFNQLNTQICLNENVTNLQAELNSKKSPAEERQEMIEARNSYKELLKKGCNAIQKRDFKILKLRNDKNIAKHDFLTIQEELKSYKEEVELELNKAQQQLDEATIKSHATEEIYNKKISFINTSYEQKIQCLTTSLEETSKSEQVQKRKINNLESDIIKLSEKLKAVSSKLIDSRKKIKMHDEEILKKTKEIKLLEKINAEGLREIDKHKKTVEAKEKIMKTFEHELTVLKKNIKFREDENKELRSYNCTLAHQEVDQIRKMESLQIELDGKNIETSSLKQKAHELNEDLKKAEKFKTLALKFASDIKDVDDSPANINNANC